MFTPRTFRLCKAQDTKYARLVVVFLEIRFSRQAYQLVVNVQELLIPAARVGRSRSRSINLTSVIILSRVKALNTSLDAGEFF